MAPNVVSVLGLSISDRLSLRPDGISEPIVTLTLENVVPSQQGTA